MKENKNIMLIDPSQFEQLITSKIGSVRSLEFITKRSWHTCQKHVRNPRLFTLGELELIAKAMQMDVCELIKIALAS